MAIRNIRVMGDPILEKTCKEVKEMTPRLKELIDDMFDTMYEANGVGLAAPQVGVLKRIVVVDVTGEDPIVLINPRILESSGEQTGGEGCLSVPGKSGTVTRPNYVKVLAYDRDMKPVELEGTELLARAFCHEIDHLDGHLYVEKVEGELVDVESEEAAAAGALRERQAGDVHGDDDAVGRLVKEGDAVDAGMQDVAAEVRPRLRRPVQQRGQRM